MRHSYPCLLGATLFLLAPVGVRAATFSIEPDGTGDQPTIQAGVTAAAAGDTLLLAPGTFLGDGNRNVLLGGKDLVVTSQGGAAVTVIDCEASDRAFLYVVGETPASVLRDVTIRNGSALSGGAVLCSGSSPTFLGCVFESNSAFGPLSSGGGAVLCVGGSPSFEGCSFSGNRNVAPEAVGGAISLTECVEVRVLNCSFEGNATPMVGGGGGALFDWFSTRVTISGCSFVENSSLGVGGGVALIQTAEATVETSTFLANTGGSAGGLGVSAQNLAVADCQFIRNEASSGGGAEISFYPVEFDRCLFQENLATGNGGGAVASYQASGLYTECVFSKNSAPRGGALLVSENATVVEGCTFHANEAPLGSVIRTRESGSASVSSSILAFSMGEIASCAGGGVTLECCDVFGTVGGDYVGCVAGQNGVNGNFSADPRFCDANGKDFTLRSDSPCAPPGATGCGLVGALPVGCGPIAVAPTSWGDIKARYRIARPVVDRR